jgi:hypothetical protein
MQMKNSIDIIGNRTRDLPTCSAVPQPTALPGAPLFTGRHKNKQFSSAKLGFEVSASIQVGPSEICASCDVIEVLMIKIVYIVKLIHF